MKTMTKKERRKLQLERHYSALVRLAEECGIKKADGKKLSIALLKLEKLAHQGAEAYCNGENFYSYNFNGNENAWGEFSDMVKKRIQYLFEGKIPPFFYLNGDPRGYALKIRGAGAGNEYGREIIAKTGLTTDWGGNGLLAPEITGN